MAKIVSNLKQLPSGRWQVIKTINGRKRRFSFETKKEALNFLRKLNKNSDVDLFKQNQGFSLEGAIEYYQAHVSSRKRSKEKIYFDRLFDFLGNELRLKYLDQVELAHMKALQTRLIEFLKASTVNRHFVCYKAFFQDCMEKRLD